LSAVSMLAVSTARLRPGLQREGGAAGNKSGFDVGEAQDQPSAQFRGPVSTRPTTE
jgi:hypothetical protein